MNYWAEDREEARLVGMEYRIVRRDCYIIYTKPGNSNRWNYKTLALTLWGARWEVRKLRRKMERRTHLRVIEEGKLFE